MNILNIQSITDLITNSSTEVYVVIDEECVKNIREIANTLLGEKAKWFRIELNYLQAGGAWDINDKWNALPEKYKEKIDKATFSALCGNRAMYSLCDILDGANDVTDKDDEITLKELQEGYKKASQLDVDLWLELNKWAEEQGFITQIETKEQQPGIMVICTNPEIEDAIKIGEALEKLPTIWKMEEFLD